MSAAVIIRCPGCGNVLGVLHPGYAVVRHRGRVWAGALVAVRCEECGEVWTAPILRDMAQNAPQTHQEGQQTAFPAR